jgi:hypothetical protein
VSNARVAGEPRIRLRIHRTEPDVWAYRVTQDDGEGYELAVGWGWSRSWPETLAHGLRSLDLNRRFPLQRLADEDES